MNEWQLKWYPVASLTVLAVVFAFCLFSGQGVQIVSGRLGGDLPGFYGAGKIVLDGDVEELYNIQRQLDSQQGLHLTDNTYLTYAYPPFVALPYAILAALPYRVAYLVNVTLMLLALVGITRILLHKYKIPCQYHLAAFTVSLFFYPVFRSILGGQNTALSLLLICLAWLYADRGNDARAGIFLGLLLFKPQYALPMIGLMLLAGRWKIFLSSMVVGTALYMVNVIMLGPGWIFEWLDLTQWLIQKDAGISLINAISWVGFLVYLLGASGKEAFSYGLSISILHSIALSYVWFKEKTVGTMTPLMPLTTISLLLIPSHTMYYDAGFLLIFGYAIATRYKKRGCLLLAIVWLCSYSQLAAPYIGFSPIFLINVFCLGISIIYLFSRKTSESGYAGLRANE